MFYYVLSGVLLAYFAIIFFAIIERAIEKQRDNDQEAK